MDKKRGRDDKDERIAVSPEEKRDRKRAKKEAKKVKKEAKKAQKEAEKKAKKEAKKAKKEEKKQAKELKKQAKKEAKKQKKDDKKRLKKERKQKGNTATTTTTNSSTTRGAVEGDVLDNTIHSGTCTGKSTSSQFQIKQGEIDFGKHTLDWDAKDSVFHKKKVELVTSLLPADLANVRRGVEENLRTYLLKYSQEFDGIALAFEKVKIVDNKRNGRRSGAYGFILNELPHIHYTVACDVLAFCPKAGSNLTGTVTECFPSHLGILVLDYFNAMIPANQLHSSGYSYDYDSEQWSRGPDGGEKDDEGTNRIAHDAKKGSKIIAQYDTIHFVIDKIHECDGIISMEGSNPSSSSSSSSLPSSRN